MLALICGLAAALVWAVHDLLVRRLAQTGAVLPMMVVVVVAGSVALVLPVLVWGGWGRMTAAAYGVSGLAGLAYVPGMLGLYVSFKLAPVRIVAPVVGAFPLMSLAIAAAQGRAVAPLEWLAVAAIVLGIGWVAVLGRDQEGAVPVQIGRAHV